MERRDRVDEDGTRRAHVAMDELRQRIDQLDERLVELLNRRAGAALAIGHLKQRLGLEVYQPDRERQVLANVRRANAGPLDDGAVTRLFERIIDEARRLEREAGEADAATPSGAVESEERTVHDGGSHEQPRHRGTDPARGGAAR